MQNNVLGGLWLIVFTYNAEILVSALTVDNFSGYEAFSTLLEVKKEESFSNQNFLLITKSLAEMKKIGGYKIKYCKNIY